MGSHRVGKSSLIEQLGERLSRHAIVDEPYASLEEEGYEHADPPSLEDFEAQLERSLVELDRDDPNVLFDRSPADVLACLLTLDVLAVRGDVRARVEQVIARVGHAD